MPRRRPSRVLAAGPPHAAPILFPWPRSSVVLALEIDAGLAVIGDEIAVVLLADVLGERPIAVTAADALARPRLSERLGIGDRGLDLERIGSAQAHALDDSHLVAV